MLQDEWRTISEMLTFVTHLFLLLALDDGSSLLIRFSFLLDEAAGAAGSKSPVAGPSRGFGGHHPFISDT